jgi:hypothetical protein
MSIKHYIICSILTFLIVELHAQSSIEKPSVFLDEKGYLAKVEDGLFLYHFEKSRFIGFTSKDSFIIYDDKAKVLEFFNESGNKVILKLDRNNLVINEKEIKVGSFKDSFFYANNGYAIIIETSSFSKKMTWKLRVDTGTNILSINCKYNSDRLDDIFIQDYEKKIGFVISTSFRTGKYAWMIWPFFREEYYNEEYERNVIRNKYQNPSFYYEFKKFGKIKKKVSSGDLKRITMPNNG